MQKSYSWSTRGNWCVHIRKLPGVHVRELWCALSKGYTLSQLPPWKGPLGNSGRCRRWDHRFCLIGKFGGPNDMREQSDTSLLAGKNSSTRRSIMVTATSNLPWTLCSQNPIVIAESAETPLSTICEVHPWAVQDNDSGFPRTSHQKPWRSSPSSLARIDIL